jgi:hypothetical protein
LIRGRFGQTRVPHDSHDSRMYVKVYLYYVHKYIILLCTIGGSGMKLIFFKLVYTSPYYYMSLNSRFRRKSFSTHRRLTSLRLHHLGGMRTSNGSNIKPIVSSVRKELVENQDTEEERELSREKE